MGRGCTWIQCMWERDRSGSWVGGIWCTVTPTWWTGRIYKPMTMFSTCKSKLCVCYRLKSNLQLCRLVHVNLNACTCKEIRMNSILVAVIWDNHAVSLYVYVVQDNVLCSLGSTTVYHRVIGWAHKVWHDRYAALQEKGIINPRHTSAGELL